MHKKYIMFCTATDITNTMERGFAGTDAKKAPAPAFPERGLLNVRNCGWRRGYALAGVFAVYSRRAKANTVPIKATTARH